MNYGWVIEYPFSVVIIMEGGGRQAGKWILIDHYLSTTSKCILKEINLLIT